MTPQLKKEAQTLAAHIRIETLKALGHLGFGHLGGALSIADLLAVLYAGEMRIDPKNPNWSERDYLVCSKGHAGPGIYATLALKGFFPMEELLTINQGGTHLPSHCDHRLTPGVDMTTGSLGQGSSLAVGVALGRKIDKKNDCYTYLILGDGEIQEGQVWEALSLAAQQKLANLITFVDWNKKQLDGYVKDINDFSNIPERFTAFGWNAVLVDGHDVAAISDAIAAAKAQKERPSCIVLDTVKGKGCSFVSEAESNHHVTISAEQLQAGLLELEAELGKAVAE